MYYWEITVTVRPTQSVAIINWVVSFWEKILVDWESQTIPNSEILATAIKQEAVVMYTNTYLFSYNWIHRLQLLLIEFFSPQKTYMGVCIYPYVH